MFYLFIFESIGTQELILIGIIAMIFLGPRRLPEYAKKIGKMMSEFRGTAQEFRSTWEREVNFEEEAEAIRSGELRETKPVPRIRSSAEATAEATDVVETSANKPEPMIRSIDKGAFDELRERKDMDTDVPETPNAPDPEKLSTDKRNWL